MSIELKIKVKHLAEEARIIRKEENKLYGIDKYYLQQHRKTTVRDAARRTQLAYAIIRGKERCITLHPNTRDLSNDHKEIIRMVSKYGTFDDPNATVKSWFN